MFTATMSVEGHAARGWLADAAEARLWRGPVCVGAGTAAALGLSKLLYGGAGPLAGLPGEAAAITAGLVLALVLFWLLRPATGGGRGNDEALATMGVPVLVAVPPMVTGRDRRLRAARRRRQGLLSGVAILLSAALAAAVLWRLL